MPVKIDERRKEYKKFGLDWENESQEIISLIEGLNGYVLEIGTGKGWFTYKLSQYSDKLVTLDIDKETQKIAKAYLKNKNALKNIDFIISDAKNLPFQDNSFDICVSVDSLHHIKYPQRAIKEIIRVVKPKGKIILCDFNNEGFSIIDKMHKSENRTHTTNNFYVRDAKNFMEKFGIKTKLYNSKCHYILIGIKER